MGTYDKEGEVFSSRREQTWAKIGAASLVCDVRTVWFETRVRAQCFRLACIKLTLVLPRELSAARSSALLRRRGSEVETQCCEHLWLVRERSVAGRMSVYDQSQSSISRWLRFHVSLQLVQSTQHAHQPKSRLAGRSSFRSSWERARRSSW